MTNVIDLILLSLATWRITSLLVYEEGPWDVFERMRRTAGVTYDPSPPYERRGEGVVAKILLCVWCCSVWVGMGVGLLYLFLPRPALVMSLFLSLSTGAVMVEEAIGKFQRKP